MFDIGSVFQNKYGNSFRIINYVNSKYQCTTLCGTYETFCEVTSIRKKTLKHPMDRSHCGVGFIGIGKHKPYIGNAKCRSYGLWCGIIYRCYNPSCKEYPYYGGKGVTVSEDWQNYQNFAEWYFSNCQSSEDNLEVDKDLLSGDCYSDKTCLLLPQKFNSFISMYFKKDLIGAYYPTDGKKRKNPWRAMLNGKHKGSFKTKEDAEKFLSKIRKDYGNKFLEDNRLEISEEVYNILKEKVSKYEPFN